MQEKFRYHLSFADVIRILRLVDETPFQELQLELDGLKLRVVQDKEDREPARRPDSPVVSEAPPETVPAGAPKKSALPASPAEKPGEKPNEKPNEGTPVPAPLAGTFYRSPFPGEPPFVEEGTAVEEGDVVGILEIMKLMNHVAAPCSGVLSRFCVQNEQFVEFGQVLAVIEPEPSA